MVSRLLALSECKISDWFSGFSLDNCTPASRFDCKTRSKSGSRLKMGCSSSTPVEAVPSPEPNESQEPPKPAKQAPSPINVKASNQNGDQHSVVPGTVQSDIAARVPQSA